MIRLLLNSLRIAVIALACDFAAFDAGADVAFYRLGETRIAVEILGQSGPVVVFVSGLGEGITAWDPVSRVLSGCARVILYDRPGIGRSSSRTGTSALLANAAVGSQHDAMLRRLRCDQSARFAETRLGLVIEALALHANPCAEQRKCGDAVEERGGGGDGRPQPCRRARDRPRGALR